jgi:hypothetical protein
MRIVGAPADLMRNPNAILNNSSPRCIAFHFPASTAQRQALDSTG